MNYIELDDQVKIPYGYMNFNYEYSKEVRSNMKLNIEPSKIMCVNCYAVVHTNVEFILVLIHVKI